MPPRGWKKPPGYDGFRRASINGRGPAKKRPASRTAGAHMLRGARATALPNLAVDIDNAASDGGSDVDDDDDVIANSEGDEGVISSRLRLRKGAPPMVDEDADMSNASASDSGCQDLPDLNEEDSAGSESDEPQQTVNSATARARRAAAARAVASDSDDEVRHAPAASAQPAARAAQAVNTNLHVLELSVTLSKSKGHVNPAWLQLIKNWMEKRTVSGAAALERGGKQQHLHLQIMLRMHIAEQDIDALKLELKTLSSAGAAATGRVATAPSSSSALGRFCPARTHARITRTLTGSLFPCSQNWMMMLGYIHKDQTLPHFKIVLHNINPNEIVKGIAEWQTAKLSYEDDKIMLTKANLFHRLSSYRLNSDPESNNSFVQDMTNLLNTKKYIHGRLAVRAAVGCAACRGGRVHV